MCVGKWSKMFTGFCIISLRNSLDIPLSFHLLVAFATNAEKNDKPSNLWFSIGGGGLCALPGSPKK